MRMLKAIIRKEFLHLKADPMMVRLMVAPVLIQLFVIGYSLTVEVRNIPFAVVDHSRTPESRSLLECFSGNPLFVFRGLAEDEGALRNMLDRGRVKAALVIPAAFARELQSPEGAEVAFLADGTDANYSAVASGYVNAMVARWMADELKERLAAQGRDLETLVPVRVMDDVRFNPLLKSTWYMIPALVVLLVTIVTAMFTGFAIVKEKENGTFEQLLVTPVKPVHVIFGKCIPGVLIGLVEIGLFFVIALFWFGIPFRGSLWTFLFFAVIYMMSSLGVGIFVSTVARTLQQVLFLTFFAFIFFILLSGFFIPVENMPHWVQVITCLNPVRFFMAAVRAIFLKGATLSQLWREAAFLIVIGTSIFALSFLFFRRKVS